MQWPQSRTVIIPAYTTETFRINRPARAASTYDWENMLIDYSENKGTDAQRDEVARLMADIGDMLESDYEEDETGAYPDDIVTGLVTYMDYDKSMQFVERSEFWRRLSSITSRVSRRLTSRHSDACVPLEIRKVGVRVHIHFSFYC